MSHQSPESESCTDNAISRSTSDLNRRLFLASASAAIGVTSVRAEETYEYGWNTFDKDVFNREVTRQLDSIYEKITASLCA